MSPQQITWHQEVTYVSIVSMNTLGFRCKMQNEVSVREYMDILVKHYDVIPYLKLLWFRCCYTPTADTGLWHWLTGLTKSSTTAWPIYWWWCIVLFGTSWEGVWGIGPWSSPCLHRCISNGSLRTNFTK